MSVLFKAIKWYAPQVVQGREAARDALVLAYQQRCVFVLQEGCVCWGNGDGILVGCLYSR